MTVEPETSEQATEASLDDAIAAKFGMTDPEPSEVEQVETEETQPQFEEVEYEGKKYQLPPELKNAFLKNADYTQKTQRLADREREVEIAMQLATRQKMDGEFAQSVNAEFGQLRRIDAALDQYKELDWSSLGTDDLIRHRTAMDQLKDKRAELIGAVNQKRAEFEQTQQESMRKLLDEGRNILSRKIPGWSDNTPKEIAEYAKNQGFSDAEINSIVEPRYVETLWKARQYDQLMANKGAALTKAATPIIKPTSSKPMPDKVKDKLAFQKQLKGTTDYHERNRLVEARIGKLFGG